MNDALDFHDRGRFGPDSDPVQGLDRRPWWLHDHCLVRELRSDLDSCTVLARKKETHDEVIVRFLFASSFSDLAAVRRVQADMATLQVLDDPRLARVIGCRVSHHGVAVMSELVRGRSLADLLESAGPLPVEAAVWVAVQTLFGLGAARQVGVGPRHLEARHVVISPGGRVKITEWAFGHEAGTARRGQLHTDAWAVVSMLFHCLTGRIPPADPALEADRWPLLGDMDRQPERLLWEWCVGLTRARAPVQAWEAGVLLNGWAAEVLGTGWEERARSHLGAHVAPCLQQQPRPRASGRRRAKRGGYARFRSVGLVTACAVVLAAVAAEWCGGRPGSSPPGRKERAAASTPTAEVTFAPSPARRAEKPQAPAAAPSPSVTAVALPSRSSAAGDTVDFGRRRQSLRPSTSPTARVSASAGASADALKSLNVTALSVGDDGVATAEVAIVATSTRPFTVTVTWHTPTDASSSDSPGPRQAAYVISLSGRLTYDFALQHQFPDGVCRIGVTVLGQPEPDLRSAYRSATGC
ncbi:hypothetical protein [Streptomyces sp. NPDC085932]|uniref:hypothetical protein n=1 Tax=Streptomyces sp. NPDC085932 TaxID=3365741 RepID=UPI0037D80E71